MLRRREEKVDHQRCFVVGADHERYPRAEPDGGHVTSALGLSPCCAAPRAHAEVSAPRPSMGSSRCGCTSRTNSPEKAHALRGVHRHGVEEDAGATKVHDCHVDFRVAFPSLVQMVSGQSVSTRIDPSAYGIVSTTRRPAHSDDQLPHPARRRPCPLGVLHVGHAHLSAGQLTRTAPVDR
jgi:hypothetical protein